MSTLAAKTCENAKSDQSGKDRILADGNGLSFRIRPNGTKTWMIEYVIAGRRRKYTIGVFDSRGAPGESITAWLEHGALSLSQARAVAGQWKMDRRAGRDPVAEWEARVAAKRAAEKAVRKAAAAEASQPTVRDAIEQFMTKQISGKKSAPAIRYRLERLADLIGDKKMRDVTRQDVISALEEIAAGQKDGKTAKQLAGEVLIQAKRVWRFAEMREWVGKSSIEPLMRKDFDARPRKREVALRIDEVVQLWRALSNPESCKADKATVAALRLLILTGQREREVNGRGMQRPARRNEPTVSDMGSGRIGEVAPLCPHRAGPTQPIPTFARQRTLQGDPGAPRGAAVAPQGDRQHGTTHQ